MDSASPFAALLGGQPTLNRQLRLGMFAGYATARLHRVSSGLPYARNNAAVAALIAAAADGKNLIDDVRAKKAVAELTRD